MTLRPCDRMRGRSTRATYPALGGGSQKLTLWPGYPGKNPAACRERCPCKRNPELTFLDPGLRFVGAYVQTSDDVGESGPHNLGLSSSGGGSQIHPSLGARRAPTLKAEVQARSAYHALNAHARARRADLSGRGPIAQRLSR